MIARGKREARRPWLGPQKHSQGLKGGNKDLRYFALSGLQVQFNFEPGATRFALAPGYHIPRLWRCRFKWFEGKAS
jgi:hypothetical protein